MLARIEPRFSTNTTGRLELIFTSQVEVVNIERNSDLYDTEDAREEKAG